MTTGTAPGLGPPGWVEPAAPATAEAAVEALLGPTGGVAILGSLVDAARARLALAVG